MEPMKRNAMRRAALALAIGLAMTARADKVTLSNGREMDAKSVQWRESTQEYRVEMADGTLLPFPKAQVAQLQIDKPADYDKAVQMVAAKQFDAALPLLDGLVTKYKMLNWDNESRLVLAQAYMGKNDAKKAAATMDEYMGLIPKGDVSLDARVLYWKALLGADRSGSLKKELDETIVSGARETAAAAQMMRANMNRQAGQKEAAFLDYMRVVSVFKDVKALQPEALYRAAELLEDMRDPRADQLRRRLAQDYKDSEWAAKVGGRE